ncbi:MAG: hypothetical protein OXH09_24580 [Gammaproteobacteria bacterium]|nr:hypothetical protein [Gammaproteobacteria bacterium]
MPSTRAVAPLIDRYGYTDAGTRRGGGAVGAHPRINDQAFRRRSVEFNVDREFQWGTITHEVHIGVQRRGPRAPAPPVQRLGIDPSAWRC